MIETRPKLPSALKKLTNINKKDLSSIFSRKPQKCVRNFRDVTSNVVNHNKSAVELLDEFTALIDKCFDRFQPDLNAVCEIFFSKLYPKLIQKTKTDEFIICWMKNLRIMTKYRN